MGRKGSRPRQYKANDFIGAIPGSGGIISTIAKRVGCDWWTAKRAIERYPSVKAAYEAECETVSDTAESTLIKAIQGGDVSASKWWLTKKRKAVFGESVDVTSGGEKLASAAELDARIAQILAIIKVEENDDDGDGVDGE